jgi:predicted kinase
MPKKLIMTRGLPGSGKSFWADIYVQEQGLLGVPVVVINKDAIRRELEKTGWEWSNKNERDVILQRDLKIIEALKINFSVISSDTNFGPKHEARLKELAIQNGAEFEIKSFLHVPVEVCIERDSKREGKARVGEKVIRGMASQHNLEGVVEIKPYIPEPLLGSAIICDLDGTLCLNKGKRSPYDYSKVNLDEVNPVIMQILETYYRFMHWDIIYLSGRDSSCRDLTQEWLRNHHAPPGKLWMRAEGDKRKDWIVKHEIFQKEIVPYYNPRFVLDDRNQVVDMWRKLGLTCLQVADGNF